MRPQRPSPDNYDSNYQVARHFVNTPGLTVIPKSSAAHYLNVPIRHQVRKLYRKHGLQKCRNYGLFWAGYPRWTMIEYRDRMKTLLLVVELKDEDIQLWWKIDDEVRQILDEHKLTDCGVCVRYYKFWPGRREEERLEDIATEQIRVAEEAAQGEDDVSDGPHVNPWLTSPADRRPLFRNSDAEMDDLAIAFDNVRRPRDEPNQLSVNDAQRLQHPMYRAFADLRTPLSLPVAPPPYVTTFEGLRTDAAGLAWDFDPPTPESLPDLVRYIEPRFRPLPPTS